MEATAAVHGRETVIAEAVEAIMARTVGTRLAVEVLAAAAVTATTHGNGARMAEEAAAVGAAVAPDSGVAEAVAPVPQAIGADRGTRTAARRPAMRATRPR